MQEIILETNGRKELRMHPVGGGVIGVLIGIALSCVVGYFLKAKLDLQTEADLASQQAGFEVKLAAANAETDRLKIYLECESTLFLVDTLGGNARRLRSMTKEFPAFKTEPYKALFKGLTVEVETQMQSAEQLHSVLRSPDIKAGARCGKDVSNSTDLVLWTDGLVTFKKDGWSRGVK